MRKGSSQYVKFSDVLDFPLTAQRTFSAWIYPITLSTGTNYILVKQDTNSPWAGWGFTHEDTGRLKLTYCNSCGTDLISYAQSAQNTIVTDQWQHVAATYNNETIQLYRNDVLLSNNGAGTAATASVDSTINFTIAVDDNSADDEFFTGRIDEVRI